MISFKQAMERLPLIAILRGVLPTEVEAVADTLVEAGFVIIEVPLNSPEPLASIETLSRRFGNQAFTGAGTVTRLDQIDQVHAAGGRLVVSPHCNPTLVRHAKSLEMTAVPGTATPTEAFTALKAGADALKLFPAEVLPPAAIKAWRAVLPPQVPLIPVGGVAPGTLADGLAAGAAGFGIGSAIYKPGATLAEVRTAADAFVRAYRAAQRHAGR